MKLRKSAYIGRKKNLYVDDEEPIAQQRGGQGDVRPEVAPAPSAPKPSGASLGAHAGKY
jgi:hypothetical protein